MSAYLDSPLGIRIGRVYEKFDKEFKNISAKFEEYFKILFSGGTAKIVKVLTEDLPASPAGGLNC